MEDPSNSASAVGTASTLHPGAQRLVTTSIAQVGSTYRRLGPQQTLNIAGGGLVLVGSYLPLFHATGMFSGIDDYTSLTRLGFGGFIILLTGLALAAVPVFAGMSRRLNSLAFGAAMLCLGIVVAVNSIMAAIGKASGGYAGGGAGLPLLLLGFAILAYVAYRRSENLEGVWGW